MRLLLILALVAAALGAAFLVLRSDPAGAPNGTGPATAASTTAPPRPELDLSRGEAAGSPRAAATAPGKADGALASPSAAPTAAGSDLSGARQDPPMENGVGVGLVSTSASNPGDEELKAKYLNWSRPERVQALQALRTTLESQRDSLDKDFLTTLPELKREMTWLEENLDG